MGKFVDHRDLKNVNWRIWMNDDEKYDNESIQRAILLDIRHALLRLCALFECPDAQRIPATLDHIVKNTRRVHRAGRRR